MISLIKKIFKIKEPNKPKLITQYSDEDDLELLFNDIINESNVKYNIYEYLEHNFHCLYNRFYYEAVKNVRFDSNTSSSFHMYIHIRKDKYLADERSKKLSKLMGNEQPNSIIEEKIGYIINKVCDYITHELHSNPLTKTCKLNITPIDTNDVSDCKVICYEFRIC